jgi:hypothetical protein
MFAIKAKRICHQAPEMSKSNSRRQINSSRKKISSQGAVKVEDFDRKLAETDIYLQLLLNQVHLGIKNLSSEKNHHCSKSNTLLIICMFMKTFQGLSTEA